MRSGPRRLPLIALGALGALVAAILVGIYVYRQTGPGPLLDQHGAGPGGQTTEILTVDGPWDLRWSYDCSNASNGFQKLDQCDFLLTVKQLSDCQVSRANQGVAEHGVKDQGLVHYQAGGTFYFVIDSDGSWTFSVTGPGRGWGMGPAPYCSEG